MEKTRMKRIWYEVAQTYINPALAKPLLFWQRAAMQFREWADKTAGSMFALAKRWGMNRSILSRASGGQKYPPFPVMARAFIESEGDVSLGDWIALCQPLLESDGVKLPNHWKKGT